MSELSLAAQAVLDAAYQEMDYAPRRHVQWVTAAALRAAVDQVVPEPDDWDKDNFSIQALRLRCVMRDQLLRIAAELSNTPRPLSDHHLSG